MKTILLSLVFLAAGARASDADLEKRVDDLQARVGVLESKITGAATWTCSASCLYYWDSAYPDELHTVWAEGQTRVSAFEALARKCADDYAKSGYTSGHHTLVRPGTKTGATPTDGRTCVL